MSVKDLKEFFVEAGKDESLKSKLEERKRVIKEDGSEYSEQEIFEKIVVPIAKESGFDVSYDDVLVFQSAPEGGELDEDDLEAVAGGSKEGAKKALEVAAAVTAGLATGAAKVSCGLSLW